MTRPEIRPVEFKLGVKSNSTALRGKMYRVSEQKGLIASSKLKCNANLSQIFWILSLSK